MLSGRFAGLIVCLWLLMALFASAWDLTPNVINLPKMFAAPEWSSWLGYDDLGRPLMDRLLVGARVSFWVSLWVISLSMSVGVLLGAFAAYSGGLADQVLVRIIDVFLAFPGILLAIALAAVLGPGVENIVFALSVVGWVGFARLSRAQVLSLKRRDHVLAARVLGASRWRIITRHLLLLSVAPFIVEATFGVAAVIVSEAGLSFLGLGVQPPDASWGSMIRDGARYMLVAPHMVLVPGLSLALVVLALNLLGDKLRDYLDVKHA